MSALPNALAYQVLDRFGVSATWLHALGNHGGFSGAWLWRIETDHGEWCLKAWPPVPGASGRLRTAHDLMRRGRAAGLAFVPVPRNAVGGENWVDEGGWYWDLTTWQPGRADFHQRRSARRIEAACTALAELHRAWRPPRPNRAVCPAIERRFQAAAEWQALVHSGWRPNFVEAADAAVAGWAERSWVVLGFTVRRVPEWLAIWRDVTMRLQPCHCDVWHDHVLFIGDAVSGLIDYGSVKRDHVSVDLARMLGSLAGDDAGLRAAGMDAYDRAVGLSAKARSLVDILDRTGTVLSLANWLRWLFYDRRQFDDPARVARRLQELVCRVESW
jgi:Ser/Thr protein kinase RdoA (MazF antagonist)